MENRNGSRGWVLVIGLLIIVLLGAAGVVWAAWRGAQGAQQALQPVGNLTSEMATQVAQALRPTPTILPDPLTIVHSVRSLARLETIQYSVEKVITAESGQGPFGFLFGDRLLLVAHGTVIAGVDLEKLAPQDLRVQDGVLYVHLPEAEVFIAALDNQKSYIYDRDVGVLSRGDVDLETAARRAAEEEIEKAALQDGILAQAQSNAEAYLYRLLIQLGFPEVIFERDQS
ncbi:MAG: DUF4230 domain-containing protein [Anaerolineales bacterium]|nr:DUF4230 domain-containing protein [Anaerolineales bacterium]